jgi:hypothetical protein
MPKYTTEDRIRAFWSKVNKTDTCWLWTGKPNATGYGQFNAGDKMWLAHRYSYNLNVGPIMNGLHVLHKCDVPLCVNPEHLFLGTQAENVQDMLNKGREAKGSKRGNAKLKEADIYQIRNLRLEGLTHRQIASRLNVSHTTIIRILLHNSWKHCAVP